MNLSESELLKISNIGAESIAEINEMKMEVSMNEELLELSGSGYKSIIKNCILV